MSSTAAIVCAAGVTFSLFAGGSTAVAAEAATNSAAPPERVEIDAAECADQVTLSAKNVMLSDVLRALAARLQFELHFKSDRDRAISVELQKPGRKLIETLGQNDNIMISSELDVRCGEPVDKLLAVWFLGTGPEITYQPVRSTRVDQLPETGDARTRLSDDEDGDKPRKKRKNMTPEELYLDKIERKNRKTQKGQVIK